jgi:threonine aldolase
MIDLRSDTVTRPTPAMRQTIAEAEVGDDVYGEDPTVRRLEAEVAELTGKAAALFVSSGTLGNQLALLVHCQAGDEVVIGEGAHCAFYESGAAAVLARVQMAVAGAGGLFTADQLRQVVKPADYYYPRTSLVCLENTHNRGGGRIFPQADVVAVSAAARSLGLAVHLDGARLWNAHVASGLAIQELVAPVDTATLCFSKGLGAPVGSVLVGSAEQIKKAHRFRKMLGGGMRQLGLLAAGARHALHHHVKRLVEDHEHARSFAERVVAASSGLLSVDLASVQTNIVNVDVEEAAGPAARLVEHAKASGVLVSATGPSRVRVVFHLDVSAADGERAAAVLSDAAKRGQGHAAL